MEPCSKSLQKAINITGQGFEAAMRATNTGSYEYQVQAELEVHFRRMGSPRNGYPSIVASGDNSCILHYIKNRAQLNDGDLLLIDAGAEVDLYTADITRTWPVNGKFSPEQRAVYQIVLDAQANAFAATTKNSALNKYFSIGLIFFGINFLLKHAVLIVSQFFVLNYLRFCGIQL